MAALRGRPIGLLFLVLLVPVAVLALLAFGLLALAVVLVTLPLRLAGAFARPGGAPVRRGADGPKAPPPFPQWERGTGDARGGHGRGDDDPPVIDVEVTRSGPGS